MYPDPEAVGGKTYRCREKYNKIYVNLRLSMIGIELSRDKLCGLISILININATGKLEKSLLWTTLSYNDKISIFRYTDIVESTYTPDYKFTQRVVIWRTI